MGLVTEQPGQPDPRWTPPGGSPWAAPGGAQPTDPPYATPSGPPASGVPSSGPSYGVPSGPGYGTPASGPGYGAPASGPGYGVQPGSGYGGAVPASGPGYGVQPGSGYGGAVPASGPGYGAPSMPGPGYGAPPPSGPGYGTPASGPGYGTPASGPGYGAGPGYGNPHAMSTFAVPSAPPRPSSPGPAGGQVRVDPVAGTPFGVAYVTVPPTVSGLAAGSLVTGIASIVLGIVIGCLGVTGVQSSEGPIVAGAFAVTAALLGFAGLGLGFAAVRQIRSSPGRVSGRGVGIAGMTCGGTGVLFTMGGLALALVLLAS
jgi:hypothetical protein